MANKQFQIGAGLLGSLTTEEQTGITTSYDTAKAHQHPIGKKDRQLDYDVPRGVCNTIWVWYDNLLSSATKLTLLLSADASGDVPIMEAKDIDITAGITTTTGGSIQVYMGIPFSASQDTPTVYLHVKTDTGTVDLQKSQISWEE
jgi:hypothetical protein